MVRNAGGVDRMPPAEPQGYNPLRSVIAPERAWLDVASNAA